MNLRTLQKLTVARAVLAKQQNDPEMYNEALHALLHEAGGERATPTELAERLAPVIEIMANDLAAATFALAGGDRDGAIRQTQQRLAQLLEVA